MGDVDRSGETPYRRCKSDDPPAPEGGWPWGWNAKREAVRVEFARVEDEKRAAAMASIARAPPPPPPGPDDVAAAVAAGAPGRKRRGLRQRVFGGSYRKAGGPRCVYCGWFAVGEMVWDHVPPLARAHEAAPGVPLVEYLACSTCNAALGAFAGVCLVDRAARIVDRVRQRDAVRAGQIERHLLGGGQRSRCLCGSCRPETAC